MSRPPAALPDPGSIPPLDDSERPLRELVADALRTWITGGDVPPGTRLVERSLAERLGVSRAPVRDALNLLKGEGLVADEPRRGVVVARLTQRVVDELLEVRSALEVLAASQACLRASDEELDELVAIVHRGEQARRDGDRAALGQANEQFHDALTAMAHNRLLTSMLEPLAGRMHWLLRQNDDPVTLMTEHAELARAVASRDAEEAARIARRHVETSRQVALRMLFPDGDAAAEGDADTAQPGDVTS